MDLRRRVERLEARETSPTGPSVIFITGVAPDGSSCTSSAITFCGGFSREEGETEEEFMARVERDVAEQLASSQ